MAWLADGQGIVTSGIEKGAANWQLWRLAYPGGKETRITNDLANYTGVSLSADSRSLVTIESDALSSLAVSAPGGHQPETLVPGGRGRVGLGGLAWTPDGRIVYTSSTSGNADLWIVGTDGSEPRQLTVDPATDAQPAVCGHGRDVFFTSTRTGTPEIWRLGLDGAAPVQMTRGPITLRPACAPDADSVIYTTISLEGRFTIWRMPLAGGEPVKLRESPVQSEAISPDGRFVAGAYADRSAERQSLAVVPLEVGGPPQVFPVYLGSEGRLAFSPDGKAITYAEVKDGVGNVWSQPLAGGARTQLTHFPSGVVFAFAWSPDGRRLAFARGTSSTDVVLLAAR
jgi:Tol biopolymer transport system component